MYEMRVDYTDREFTGKIAERRLLFPDVPRATDCTEMSERLEGHACTEGRKGTVCGDVGSAVCEEERGEGKLKIEK